MTKWQAKTFHNSKAVKLIIFKPDKRVQVDYVIPEGVTVTSGSMSWIVNEGDFFLSDGFPTFAVSYQSQEPVNPLQLNDKSLMTSEMLNVAITARVAGEILAANGDRKLNFSIWNLVILAAVAGLGYFMYMNFQTITELVNDIKESLMFLGV
jgi:hypothetical protein